MSKSIFTTLSDRILKEYNITVEIINRFELSIQALSTDQLKSRFLELKSAVQTGEVFNNVLAEILAVVREMSLRTLGLRPSDSQLLAVLGVLQGNIVELQTGEGKSLATALSASVKAISGEGVHVMQCSEYLSTRDFQMFNRFFQALDLTVGSLHAEQTAEDKREAYLCDVTYGTSTDFAVDHLHDLSLEDASERVQRGLNMAIVDDADTSLIDEAYTVLVISGANSVGGALPSTNVNKNIRGYKFLSGLTGSANTDIEDFKVFYGLEVINIPLPEKSKRLVSFDRIYKLESEKLAGLMALVVERNLAGQPVLIHTTLMQTAQKIISQLNEKSLGHVAALGLNEARDAFEVEQAGRPGAITVVLKNAGFGQHIEVSAKALEAGGLLVIGAERQQSRRLDQKVFSRSAARAQPGGSAFFVSLEDETMKLMASDKIVKILEKNKFPMSKALESEIVGNSIAIVQSKLEQHNYSLRARYQGG